jgi:hypothetical protein
MDWTLVLNTVVALGSGLGVVVGLAWWLSGQFSKIRELVYTSAEKILNKLDYHEAHDDTRFNAVNNELWAIKLRNATADDFARRILMDISDIKREQDKEEN